MRFDKQKVARVEKLLLRAEEFLHDPAKHSAGQLWRGDVKAIRYVFDRLTALAKADGKADA